jgi:hypothetical protein
LPYKFLYTAAKTVKDMMPLAMGDGHFAEFVKNQYNIDAELTKAADQELKEDLNYWDYNEEEQDALKENPNDFFSGYFKFTTEKAAAARMEASGDSDKEEEDYTEEGREAFDDNMPVANTPEDFDDGHLKPAAYDDRGLKPPLSVMEVLRKTLLCQRMIDPLLRRS